MLTLRKWFRRYVGVIGYIILTIGVAVALTLTEANTAKIKDVSIKAAVQAAAVSCQSTNEVRSGATDFVVTLTENSLRSNRATLASPLASPAQKLAASTNLAAILETDRVARMKFALKDCASPPPLKVLSPK